MLIVLAIATVLVLVVTATAFVGRKTPPPPPIIIDGSNVMFWMGPAAELAAVMTVISELTRRGFLPGVMFDANIGYQIGTRYQDDRELARRLGLPEDRVLVVPKGTPADEYILKAARNLGAKVVSNDRYRDWAEAYPEVTLPGQVIRGGYRDGKFWLERTDPLPGEG